MNADDIKVLVLEDERSYLRLLEALLTEASGRGRSFAVTGADTLALALGLLGANSYDAILADLFLPDSAGLDTFTALCGRAGNTPIVLLTGLDNEALAEEALRRGAQDYLLKKMVTGENLSRALVYAIERNGIEVSLRASEEGYRSLIDALDDAIVVLDAELRVVMSNRAFKKASQADPSNPAVSGRKLQEAIPGLPAKCLETCRQALSEGRLITAEEPCLWNNRQSVLETRYIPIMPDGVAGRIVVVARDITERKQVEQLKDDFASLVSHELRAPLTSITAGIGMILEDGAGHLQEEEKQLLSISYKDAQRLNRIISKLLEMSRLNAGTSRFKKTVEDVAAIADEVVARFAGRAKCRGIELLKRYSPGKLETLLDADGITEVFTNLISNALKFTEKGYIEIGAAGTGDLIECYVKDTGTGISREDQTGLFMKFKRFGKPVAEEEKGTGLGLFIVKEILRRHGGTLSVASEPGKGTTFTFTLPKLAEEIPEAPEKRSGNLL
ncbi:MAG: response regulator [Elusimicrobia bacterium]|nr:response regulator [Elusimicrobiota bacterium]